jgi:hypothetical protein
MREKCDVARKQRPLRNEDEESIFEADPEAIQNTKFTGRRQDKGARNGAAIRYETGNQKTSEKGSSGLKVRANAS